MRLYQVEVYLPAYEQWVSIGPRCSRDLEALRILDYTPAPDSQKRILVVETAEGVPEAVHILASGVDTRHVQFARYLIGTGRLSDGIARVASVIAQVE